MQLRMRVRRCTHNGVASRTGADAGRPDQAVEYGLRARCAGRRAAVSVLTVVDQWSRQSPILEVASGFSGATVGLALDRVLPMAHGLRSITVDHGTEFVSRALEDWAYQRGVQLDFIRRSVSVFGVDRPHQLQPSTRQGARGTDVRPDRPNHAEAVDKLDVQGILAFEERILPRVSDLWVQASLEYRQRLQALFFPVRRKSVQSNRRNGTTFQVLGAVREC